MRSKSLKAGILAILVVIPAFVFVFLEIFGENVFALPYKYPIGRYGDEKVDSIFSEVFPGMDIQICSGAPNNDTLYLKWTGALYSSFYAPTFIIPQNESLKKETSMFKQRLISRVGEGSIKVQDYKPGAGGEINYKGLPDNQDGNADKAFLIDPSGFFRGSYDLQDIDEQERAIVETEILLKTIN